MFTKKNIIKFIMDNFFKLLIKHFTTTGIFIAFILAFLEIISQNNRHIEIFAFTSGSFFIINLIQFYLVNKNNSQANSIFLIQSIIGGLIWVFYSIFIYILYINNFLPLNIIFITFFIILFTTLLHFILVKYDFFNKLY